MNPNKMKPSNWLRMSQMQQSIDFCATYGATSEVYSLPELPQEMLDRLDTIEPEHLGPIATEVGEITWFGGGTDRIQHYDAAPHRLYVELEEHEFLLTGEWQGGAGFFKLYESKTKPNVMYLTETDGESGCWVGVRFGHYSY